MRKYRYSFLIWFALSLFLLTACGDTATPVVPTTSNNADANTNIPTPAATTIPATSTPFIIATKIPIAATMPADTPTIHSTISDIPLYNDATQLDIPSSMNVQFSEFLKGLINNTQSKGFVTTKTNDEIKTFYQQYFINNGWTDFSAFLTKINNALSSENALELGYSKGRSIVIVLILPANLLAANSFPNTTIPPDGTVALIMGGDLSSNPTLNNPLKTAATYLEDTPSLTVTNSNFISLIAPNNATEIVIPPSIISTLETGLSSSKSSIVFKTYVSNSEVNPFTTTYVQELANKGWKGSLFTNQQAAFLGVNTGFYTLKGINLYFWIGTPATFLQLFSKTNKILNTLQTIELKQLIGNNKTFVLIVSGSLLKNVFQNLPSADTPTISSTSSTSTVNK